MNRFKEPVAMPTTPPGQRTRDRYRCNAGHVPQVAAKPPVTSTFGGTTPAKR